MSEQLARGLGIDRDKGLLVLRVRKEGPAENAGMKAGDVILRMNDRDVREPADVRAALRSLQPGDPWRAEVSRKGRSIMLEGRADPGWDLPQWNSTARAPNLSDRGAMPSWARRDPHRLERELRGLRERIEELERRLGGR